MTTRERAERIAHKVVNLAGFERIRQELERELEDYRKDELRFAARRIEGMHGESCIKIAAWLEKLAGE